MKPAAFEYVRPESIDEVVSLLAEHGGEAKIIAGGQSLMTLLNFRMLRPALLIDINRIPDLGSVVEEAGRLRVGARTRHHTLEMSPIVAGHFPVLSEAMSHVAHLAIRNRGTIGGSLSHADPAAELPMMAMLLDAEIEVRAKRENRTIAAADFFVAPLTSALEEDEFVTDIVFPKLPARTGWAFEEFAQRSGDFAIAAVAALVSLRDGKIEDVRIAAMGVDETPLRFRDVEAELAGQTPTVDLMRSSAASMRTIVQPNTDLKASADYRRHLVEAIAERVLVKAWRCAEEVSA
ncbi:caffeine dehydrogenase subunit beta [Variibacter gotjawalensis]|uniref:Caffeine dehydrogenase subunit beta n=1 Tax=Variibacter gotjawalensis TaxID=1333996 RepID=A0A0S3Q043_9BRAD|nr:xanthine dehydrogenase family protein subunit M [Variibacter gotjawalensis]NIK47342.1 carbon-monoxide dehydrogenase medium subunit [Variibacter gotjawalensis]RZS49240.1 carbon-monoxide dehydrogenase medium subunit [Variibacter gotjawalensis]BAT61502.1 caffeine dehydrogenase subunit beta [Variibacter gotjawalensis]